MQVLVNHFHAHFIICIHLMRRGLLKLPAGLLDYLVIFPSFEGTIRGWV